MAVFTLTTQDPLDPWPEDPPASLMPLADWLAQYRGQELVWLPRHHDGIGVRLGHGTAAYRNEAFGPAGHLARNCEALADRLEQGNVGILLADLWGECAYYVLEPAGDVVRGGLLREKPRYGMVPYSPNTFSTPPEDVAEVHAWAAARVDDVSEVLPAVPREELIADLRVEAVIAQQVAEIDRRVNEEINRVLLKMSEGPAR
ncbi:hypothetical protein FKR81_34710 [Lentzea tibetensis]|uniref:Uncharacterized protein n=1 Tax=Lentzea tibetensis TaxID=2591470 RepID=A0A563EJ28_9PSEU|nr:hypothetical protein [Lentzea tibetensis]TWP46739.1 hypothetical protein FKR81_34710 [Lentzea tibetensis]